MSLTLEQKRKIEEEEQYRAQLTPINTQSSSGPNKLVAALFGIFLGGLGIHKFYLGKTGWGIVYLLFILTGIPSIVGFIEGIIYLTMSDSDFAKKYSKS